MDGGIGRKIKERRLQLGITQEQLSEKMGYKSKSTINKIEKGINDVTQSKIVAFADILGTTPAYLMGWTEEPNNKEKAASEGDDLAPLEKQLSDMLRFLTEDQKKLLLAQIDTLLKTQQ